MNLEEFLVFIIVVAAILYFLPTIIALWVKKRNWVAIFLVNLFFGATFIGWIIALIWACTKDKEYTNNIIVQQSFAQDLFHRLTAPGTRPCPFCAELIKNEAIKCRFCGETVPRLESITTTPSAVLQNQVAPPIQESKQTSTGNKSLAYLGVGLGIVFLAVIYIVVLKQSPSGSNVSASPHLKQPPTDSITTAEPYHPATTTTDYEVSAETKTSTKKTATVMETQGTSARKRADIKEASNDEIVQDAPTSPRSLSYSDNSTPASTISEQNTSEVTPRKLGLRSVTIPSRSYEDDPQESGKVVLEIEVDENCRLIAANFQSQGSTISNRNQIEIAKRRAREMSYPKYPGGFKQNIEFAFEVRN